jgi:predicted glycosyltransferase
MTPVASRPIRAILFCNEMLGLGHLSLSLAVAEALVGDPAPPESAPGEHHSSSALVVSGSPAFASRGTTRGVDVLKLPTLPVGPDSGWAATSLQPLSGLAMSEPAVRALRESLCLASVRGLRPDIAVVDYRPLGRGGELSRALEWLRAETNCTIAFGMWDVDDAAPRLRRDWTDELAVKVGQFYDLALVYGTPAPDDPRIEALRAAGVPICETGLVGVRPADDPPHDLGEGYLLVTAGGGADGFPLLSAVLDVIRARPLPLRAVLVSGPLMVADRVAELRTLAAGLDVRVERSRPDMDRLLAGARAVIAMAGYCTVAEILASGKPALLVPRAFPREEQLNRARRWAAAGRVEMVEPDRLDTADFRQAIDRVLTRAPRPGFALTGAHDAARILRAHQAKASPVVPAATAR